MCFKKTIKITGATLLFIVIFYIIGFCNPMASSMFYISIAEASETKTLGDLKIGDRVVDKSWQWEYRTGDDYTFREGDPKKPVVWIVAAREHYGEGSGITLLAEELISVPSFSYLNSDRYWEDSALRLWLNSLGVYAQEGFYRSFSASFRNYVVPVDIPNKETASPNRLYTTRDMVFVASATELGDVEHTYSPAIGRVYPFFENQANAVRTAFLNSEPSWYWTRSPRTVEPDSDFHLSIVCVDYKGGFTYRQDETISSPEKSWPPTLSNRPAVNLKTATIVTAQANAEGFYEIVKQVTGNGDKEFTPGDINSDSVIDVKDVVLAMRFVLGLADYTEREKKAADVNGDGVIDVLDVTLIMRRALGIIEKF